MAFTTVCRKDAVAEGGMGLFQVGKKSVLLVWPQGGQLKAYRGRCPHADMPLTEGCFDGQRVVCSIHQWGYDGRSGKCVSHAHPSTLHAYALQVEGDDIQVDVGPVKAAARESNARQP